MSTQKISPFLWFDNQAAEAAEFYTSIFKNSKVTGSSPMVTIFELEGQRFMALNGGPQFKFNEAVSFYVTCEDQEEIDYFWNKLTEGGEESQCGWLKDKFGLSWQIIPAILEKMMSDKDREKSQRVVNAFLKMKKFNIAELIAAYNVN